MQNILKKTPFMNREILFEAIVAAFKKLNPYELIKNPVMFCVEVVATWLTVLCIYHYVIHGASAFLFDIQITIWLWFTILFGNFSEAIAEGHGKAHAESLKATKKSITAHVVDSIQCKSIQDMSAEQLKKGMLFKVEQGELIPSDGEVVAGMATIDESAVTGESAPVIRESGTDQNAVTAGTRVLSDQIVVRVSCNKGESFLDKMIDLVEGAQRKKTPNEIALSILLAGFTLIFIVVTISLPAFANYMHVKLSIFNLIALFVTLIPTTIAGLLSAVGISGMDRLLQKNVLAKSGRAVEAAGDIDTLLLDKTGTITLGNRYAVEFIPIADTHIESLTRAAYLSSIDDNTPEGKSIVTLAVNKYKIYEEQYRDLKTSFIPFSAYTRMSGVDIDDEKIRKGAVSAIISYTNISEENILSELNNKVGSIAKDGGTPLVVTQQEKVLGIIHLKDVIKQDISKRFSELRRMGIKTIMVTGDNPLTAASIAAEAGVDDFIAQANPETKLNVIKAEQQQGKMVAMCGDGTNDAPALAQADVGMAMASGTTAARDAGNMVDLDSDPTKLIEVIKIGKQLLMTRGALTTFSITNDLAKYFAIIPALFVSVYPALAVFNIMHLHSPKSAVLSAIIFNAIIIIMLIPMALKGVKYRIASAASVLRRNLLLYCTAGFLLPFLAIKIIDLIVTYLGLA